MPTCTIGKLLTTPSRLLKLVLPLTTLDQNSDRKDIAPLALLVHPQQPLSYLERLIQSELPSITNEKGENRVPAVSFKAMEARDDEIKPEKVSEETENQEDVSVQRGDHVETYGGAGREGKGEDDGDFVRWSASTEIGDFIRDAARAKEFEVEIEGAKESIKIGVPSFNDRTFYLRQRLRKTSRKLSDMATVKKECDKAAHRGGQRIAMAGCGILVGYWYIVYRLTFETDLGWDTMEPVTYLVGLSTLIGGYMWFLYHNREVSYRSALNITISRRQSKLYELKGFDLPKWEGLVEEGNAIRKEIKAVASEYDVGKLHFFSRKSVLLLTWSPEWDERKDEQDPVVTKALRDDRKATKNGSKSKKEDEDDDDDEADNKK
jgi:calcium uniporter protein, mitochondrial